MKKSTIGVYFTGLLGPWITGVNRVLTDSTSFLQSEVSAAQLAQQAAAAAQGTAEQYSAQSGTYATASQQSASTSQNYAEQAQIALSAVQAILKTMNAEWLGSFATDPKTDNNGLPLTDKAIYYNTTSKRVRVFESGVWVDADQSVQDAMQNAINAAGAASASASAAAASATASSGSADEAEYWANLAKQYAQTVSAQAVPLTAALAGKYVKINDDGTAYQFDDPTTVLETIGAAPALSPSLTGIPTAPTAAQNTATSQIATCGFMLNQASGTMPIMSSASGRIGTSFTYARGDHAHPVDTSRAAVNGDITKLFKASVFLASWGTAGCGYSFVSDTGFDSGMFSQKEGDVFFMANGVNVSEFTTTGWTTSVPLIGVGGISTRRALSIAKIDGSSAANFNWVSGGGAPNPDILTLDFGSTPTHYFMGDGSFILNGSITSKGSLTTTGNIAVSDIFEAGGNFPVLTQGCYTSWGTVSGSGVTDFVNFRGSGAGGFKWYNTTPAEWKNTSDKTNLWLGYLDQSGNLTVKGTVTTKAISATTSASTLYGISFRAALPTMSFYIAQSNDAVASITVDNNGTYRLLNSDSTERFISDFTYSTINFGPNESRSVFSCNTDGGITYSRNNIPLMSFNQNGFTFNKRVNLNFNQASADVTLIQTTDTTVRGTSLKLVGGVGAGFAYGTSSAYLDASNRWVADTVVAQTQMVAPAYYAGNGANGGGYFFQTAQQTGLSLLDSGALCVLQGGVAQVSFGAAETVFTAAKVTVNNAASFLGKVGLTGLTAANGTEILTDSNFSAAGNLGTSAAQKSPGFTARTTNGVNFQMYAASSTTTGDRGILALFTGNTWYNYGFTSTAILYPNGNTAIHSDNSLIGQTINGHLTVNQGITTGAGIDATATTGGTGTNSSVRPGDLITGAVFSSRVYNTTSNIRATFAVRDTNGQSYSYAAVGLVDSTNTSRQWVFDQNGAFLSAGHIHTGANCVLYTDGLASKSTKTINVASPLIFQNGTSSSYRNDGSASSGTAGAINRTSRIEYIVDQRNSNFSFRTWCEENVGSYVGGVFQASDGSQTNYFYMMATGEFRCQFVNAVSSSANYADYAEKYRAKVAITPGSIVRIANDDDHLKYGTDPADELAPACLSDGMFFAVVSTNPGHTLNDKQEYGLPIALAGRVPVRISGPIRRGEPVTVSDIPGVAKRGDTLLVGFALETNLDTAEKLVEVALGGKTIATN